MKFGKNKGKYGDCCQIGFENHAKYGLDPEGSGKSLSWIKVICGRSLETSMGNGLKSDSHGGRKPSLKVSSWVRGKWEACIGTIAVFEKHRQRRFDRGP